VGRAFQEAVDEAYRDIVDNDVIHEREDVVASWRETGTWIEPPVFAVWNDARGRRSGTICSWVQRAWDHYWRFFIRGKELNGVPAARLSFELNRARLP
jgi:hypothetical protein